ncbi:MAG TPA: NAD(P)H-dependent oxidoreductase [Chitinophagaceae bacterium]|nr:NAD(P)H-dependent oxidoreductase [Chitinophagaceae bacterium]
MAAILILFAHPALEKSRVHTRLLRHIRHLEGVTIHDLYEHYPDFDIDVQEEQRLLLRHDIIIMQHPFYWYSTPAILKQWQDLVLEHAWAYGSKGKMLTGKKLLNAISCGGRLQAYQPDGLNRYTIRQLLSPIEQTARLCNMIYMPPFVIHGTHKLNDGDIELYSVQYEQLLIALRNDRIADNEWQTANYMNDLIPIPEHIQS